MRRSSPKPHESMRPWVPADRPAPAPVPATVRERLQVLRVALAGGFASHNIPAALAR